MIRYFVATAACLALLGANTRTLILGTWSCRGLDQGPYGVTQYEKFLADGTMRFHAADSYQKYSYRVIADGIVLTGGALANGLEQHERIRFQDNDTFVDEVLSGDPESVGSKTVCAREIKL